MRDRVSNILHQLEEILDIENVAEFLSTYTKINENLENISKSLDVIATELKTLTEGVAILIQKL